MLVAADEAAFVTDIHDTVRSSPPTVPASQPDRFRSIRIREAQGGIQP
jgi:hypothetical protein